MNRQLIGAATGALLAATTAAQAEITTCAPDSGNRAIAETFNGRWLAAIAARDAGGIAALYDESAVLMPPSDETFVGREPVVEYLASQTNDQPGANYTVDIVACELRGEAMHVAGVWGADTEGNGRATGNLLRVLEPAPNGRWVSRYEIWN